MFRSSFRRVRELAPVLVIFLYWMILIDLRIRERQRGSLARWLVHPAFSRAPRKAVRYYWLQDVESSKDCGLDRIRRDRSRDPGAVAFLLSTAQETDLAEGAVIVQDEDTRERLPIADVAVAVTGDKQVLAKTTSDSSGLFTIQLPATVRRGREITLQFRHREYQPSDLHEFVAEKLYIAQMVPIAHRVPRPTNLPGTTVTRVRVRYSIKAQTAVNIGSAVKPFQVVNAGNVPCDNQDPCSPDRKWKAAIGSAFLDAGTGNEFRNARVSCIAGPCPFTRIERDDFSKGGRTIKASARSWSDTTTFLLEAEVFHPMVSETVHESHPVIFGRGLDFTLPSSAEGVCIEADIAGQTIIFPLGPALFLSWATCNATVNRDQTKVYRCELKPDYEFPATSHEGQQP